MTNNYPLLGDNRNPSEVTNVYWIYAKRKIGNYPESTIHSGKWLVFISPERLDVTWRKIRDATEDGKLGDESKTATSKPNLLAGKSKQKVICVYTYDWTDEEDVKRIREELRRLGIVWKIPYKTDQDTSDGKYRISVHQKIAKWFE